MSMKLSGPFFLLAFSVSLQAQTVRIAAAGNLRYVLDEIRVAFAVVHPEVDIVMTLSASGALFQQISNGAKYDVYMAADKVYPDQLKKQGLVEGDVRTYAFGKLILWSNTIDVSKGMDVLTSDAVHRIALAKPRIAPYGDRALECLDFYGLLEKVQHKMVYADNIAQAAQFTQTGNAQIGFLALALTQSPGMEGAYFELDAKSYSPVEQAMVLIGSRQSNPEATRFMDFVLSEQCHPIFEKYGFIVP